MVLKIYALTWVLAVASAAVLYFTGNLNDIMLIVFGLIFSTVFFSFFIAVLPWLMDRHYTWKY